jgi:hypothetical protein
MSERVCVIRVRMFLLGASPSRSARLKILSSETNGVNGVTRCTAFSKNSCARSTPVVKHKAVR